MSFQRILHVEDEPSIQMIAQVALQQVGGLDVLSCSSGNEALEKIAAFVPEFVLLDVMMPGIDGPSTLAAIRALPAFAQVPVAFMTAKVQSAEVEALLALGACGVIAKPFDPMTLAAQVRALYDRATAVRS